MSRSSDATAHPHQALIAGAKTLIDKVEFDVNGTHGKGGNGGLISDETIRAAGDLRITLSRIGEHPAPADRLREPGVGHITPQMIRDTAGWEQMEDELRNTLRHAADALEANEEQRAEQWRLRRDAEASRDAARAACDSLRLERDALRTTLGYAADQLSRAHDDAFKQAAGYAIVTADGREFSCYELNMCQAAAGKARAAIAASEANHG